MLGAWQVGELDAHAATGGARDEVAVSLLGPITVCVAGGPARLTGQLGRLAATLFLAPGGWTWVETLIDRLGEETPPLTARERIQDLIRDLRDALAAAGASNRHAVIQHQDGMYRAA